MIKTILALLLACGIAPAESDKPGTTIKVNQGQKQHFCCDDVDDGEHGKGGGKNCTAIGSELINGCTSVLYCAGNWKKNDKGIVTCL